MQSMKFWNIKKIVILVIVLLVSCDVTLLFAAQTSIDANGNVIQPSVVGQSSGSLQQAQQLQQQASIKPVAAPQSNRVLSQNDPAAFTPQQSSTTQPLQPSLTQVQPQTAPVVVPGQLPQPQVQQTAQQAAAQQQVAQAQGVPNPNGAISEQDLNSSAFSAVTQNALPMSPEQIQRLRQLFNQTQYAATTDAGTPPRPATTSEFVNLAPGSTPPVVRLQQGFVTSLVFVDSTGAPWPVEAYDIGNPSAFNIQWNKTDNIFMIQATTLYTYGNLAVKLQGLATPVMITLISGQKAVDYRRELRIPGYGPNAKPVATTGMPNSANPVLLGVLDGVPPAGSTALKISGGGAEIWLLGDHMYVRTHYTVLSPAWLATMSSADGTKAYEMPKAPLLLVSQNGKIVQLKIEGL